MAVNFFTVGQTFLSVSIFDSLCNLCVLWVSAVNLLGKHHHRGTEFTKDAQRFSHQVTTSRAVRCELSRFMVIITGFL